MRKKNIIVASLVAGCYVFTACSSSQQTTSGNTGTSSTQETSTNASGNTSSPATGSTDHSGHNAGGMGTTGTASGSSTDGASGNTSSAGSTSTSGMGSTARSGMAAVTQQLHQSMQSMMDKMMQMKMTGDVDHDFAHLMAEHHQGAIDMSRILLQSGDDEQIRSLAQQVTDKQKQEIEQLKAFSKQQAQASGDKTNSDKLMESMHGSMTTMQHEEMTGDADHDYAHMMVQHHKDAIAMAKVETQYGKNAELKSMAQKIMDDSQKEIEQLQTWIKTDSK